MTILLAFSDIASPFCFLCGGFTDGHDYHDSGVARRYGNDDAMGGDS